MSVRRNPNHRTARGAEGRPRPSIRQERLSSLPPPSPEERRGHRPPRADRNREDHVRRPTQRGSRPEPGSLSTQESVLGGSPGLLRRHGAPRLSREDCQKRLTTAIKPQYVDKLSKVYSGRVRDLLTKIDRRGRLAELTASLELDSFLDRDISQLSGGELQRMAIAATMLKDADIYFFDEP